MTYKAYRSYTESDVKENAPNRGGVYIIRVKLTDGNSRVIYVGQSNDLRGRLLDHLRSSEPNVCIKNHVSKNAVIYSWIEVPTQAGRDREEAYKIEEHNPQCNVQRPTA